MSLRVDRAGKCYTGVLCGLGWNPTTGAPILPEHDIELAFDVQFSVEDIVEVRPRVPPGVTATPPRLRSDTPLTMSTAPGSAGKTGAAPGPGCSASPNPPVSLTGSAASWEGRGPLCLCGSGRRAGPGLRACWEPLSRSPRHPSQDDGLTRAPRARSRVPLAGQREWARRAGLTRGARGSTVGPPCRPGVGAGAEAEGGGHGPGDEVASRLPE